jgi:hypothetical protein
VPFGEEMTKPFRTNTIQRRKLGTKHIFVGNIFVIFARKFRIGRFFRGFLKI